MQNVNLLKVTAGSGINQIRGINRSGATGAGIPAHVTNVSTSMANASAGSTSTISVTFRRDPTDLNFNGVTVWVKGYQGNLRPTQVASGTDSPINFILSNTGEALSVTVQANGNGGSAPITTAPTAGLTLPKSSSGGAGTTTTTSGPTLKTNGTSNSSQSTLNLKNGNAITVTSGAGGDETIALTSANIALAVPAELTVSGSPVTNGAGGTITIGKATETAGTAWRGPISGSAAAPTFRKDQLSDTPIIIGPFGYRLQTTVAASTTATALGGVEAEAESVLSASTTTDASTTLAAFRSQNTGAGASTNTSVWSQGATTAATIAGDNALANLLRWVSKCRQKQTTNTRVWQGMSDAHTGASIQATFNTDTPAVGFVGFRFSSTTDTHWVAFCSVDATHLTTVDTGISIDTANFQTLQWDFDGTNVNFSINGSAVAQISTNLPTTILRLFGSLDNKNTANASTFDWQTMLFWPKS